MKLRESAELQLCAKTQSETRIVRADPELCALFHSAEPALKKILLRYNGVLNERITNTSAETGAAQ